MIINNIATILLAAGKGTRLKPLTDEWPKCLMPIGSKPLLEYWLEALKELNLSKTLVNLHYLAPIVIEFLSREKFNGWAEWILEEELLGTAGTIKKK